MTYLTRLSRTLLLGIALAALVACGGQSASSTPAASPAASGTPTAGGPAFAGQTLTLVTHDSFAVSTDVISGFERLTGARLQILQSGDAGEALNKSILAKGAPLGDVFYGVDNTFLSRALDSGIFEPYAPKGLDALPAELKLDSQSRLIPIDHAYVNINYDKAALSAAGLQPPANLRDLTTPEWKGKLVVENPATSSPGLAFLLATIGHFGESGDYTWRDFWRDLRANNVKVTAGWTEAYEGEFSGGGQGGTRPLVVSYATSPAAAVIYSDPKLSEAPTGNVLPPGGAFRQIEFAGILQGTKNPDLARAWMDYMISQPFQSDVGGQMLVYPALASASVPAEFTAFAQVPGAEQIAAISPEQIAQNRDAWIAEWTEIVIR